MINKSLTMGISILCLYIFSGCAAIINGVSDNVNVNSNNPNTDIYLDGQPYGKGLASIRVRRGKFYTLTGKLPGCQDTNIQTGRKLDQLAYITLPLDLLIGSAWEVEPRSYMLNPACPVEVNGSSSQK